MSHPIVCLRAVIIGSQNGWGPSTTDRHGAGFRSCRLTRGLRRLGIEPEDQLLSGGGQEWRHWAGPDVAGIEARHLPPAQIKAFAASRGTRATTDRIDAELIARFLAFRPDAGRAIHAQKLRFLSVLTRKWGRLAEPRKAVLGAAPRDIALQYPISQRI